MGTKDKQDHQLEPWTQDGRYILDSSGWTLASARFPADARRIIAAVNAVRGIPTDALESWVANVMGLSAGADVAGRGAPVDAPSVTSAEERRMAARRHGERRAAGPEMRLFGSTPVYQEYREDEGGEDVS